VRFSLTITGIAAAGLLAGGVIAAAPAYAAGGNALQVIGGTGYQYQVTCQTASTCNSSTGGTLEIQFNRTGPTDSQSLGVYYKITNGTAVNGTDFNTPATGEAIIGPDQVVADLDVPTVDEPHTFGTSTDFTVTITSTTYPITISTGTATNTILGGNIPPDCSFTYISGNSQSMTCTQRPATQVWDLQEECYASMLHTYLPFAGTQVTGNGTSTATCNQMYLGNPFFIIDS
jgi:hypothetical protein